MVTNMRTLKESLLTKTKTKVGDFAENFGKKIIEEWLTENVDFGGDTYTISDKPNTNGKYVVTVNGNDFFRHDIRFGGTETTNGMFVYDFVNMGLIVIKGKHIKRIDGFEESSPLNSLSIASCTSLEEISNLPKCVSFTVEYCYKLKSIKLPETEEYDGGGRLRVNNGRYEINNCGNLKTIEFSSSFFEMHVYACGEMTFKNAPNYAGWVVFENCANLKSLKGLPKRLGGLELKYCPNLTSFKGDVKTIDDNIRIISTGITEFSTIPKVGEYIEVGKCNIKDWSFPKNVPPRVLWGDLPDGVNPPPRGGRSPLFCGL